MKLSEFLKNKSFIEIKNILEEYPYNIKVTELNNLYMLKYNQIKSDFSNDIVKESRGCILEKNTNKFICRPFDKFFNYGETNAAKIDFKNANVLEKVDGSLIKFYYYNNSWHIATNGTIDAKIALVNNTDKTFRDLVLDALAFERINLYALETNFDINRTYMFELVHPLSKVVINYGDPKLYYLGSRDNETGQEKFNDIRNLRMPKIYQFGKFEDIIKSSKELPFNEEGYVVVDKNFNRVKVKSPAYVQAHYFISNGPLTKRRMIDIIKLNEKSEFLNYFPEMKKDILKIENDMNKYIEKIKKDIDKIDDIKEGKSRKELALIITKMTSPNIIFRYIDGKIKKEKIYDEIINIPSNKLENII